MDKQPHQFYLEYNSQTLPLILLFTVGRIYLPLVHVLGTGLCGIITSVTWEWRSFCLALFYITCLCFGVEFTVLHLRARSVQGGI